MNIQSIIICCLLVAIFLWGSIEDIRHHVVGDYIHMMVLIVAILSMPPEKLPVALLSGLLVAIPFFIVAIAGGEARAIGGADIKFAFSVGFLLGIANGLVAMLVGMVTAIAMKLFSVAIGKSEFGESFALIPYLCFGTLIVWILGGGI